MDSKAAQDQIAQMISFVTSEAKDKASEIQKKGDEEFSIEVHRLMTEQIERQYAIAKSMAINKQRLEKIKARQEVMHKIDDDVRARLVNESSSKAFITKLIVQ